MTSMIQSFYCLLQLIDWLIDWLSAFLLRIMNWSFPGLAIIWLFSNQFNAIFKSDWRFSITFFTDLAQLYMVLLSAKLQMSVFSINRNMSFKKILKNNGPRTDPCGTPKPWAEGRIKFNSLCSIGEILM